MDGKENNIPNWLIWSIYFALIGQFIGIPSIPGYYLGFSWFVLTWFAFQTKILPFFHKKFMQIEEMKDVDNGRKH
jgi:hypothetical protein